MSEQQGGGLKEMQERISGYHVYDRHYEKVGKVDDLFVDANDELEYIGLEMGGMLSSKTALVPMELVRINDRRDLIEIEADKKQIEDSPTFGKDEEITSEYESEVHRHFGLRSPDSSGERGSYGDFEYDTGEGRHEESSGEERDDDVDTEYGERAGSGGGSREPQNADRQGDDSSSRSESPERGRSGAAAQTGEREGSQSGGREGSSSGSGGGARVRKRLRVPVRREEVHVDRVETGGGDDELRVRKEVVEGEETVDVPDGTVEPGEDTGRRVR